MKAIILEISATVECKFTDLKSLDGGSLYVEALDFGTVVFCADVERSNLKNSSNTVALAEMWESELAYSYYQDNINGSWVINVEGGLAAEIFDDEKLEFLNLKEPKLKNMILSWAEDGDSPKFVGQDASLIEAGILSIEVNNDFEEYP